MNRATDLDPLGLYDRPARLGELGARVRDRAFGSEAWVRPAPTHPMPTVAACLRSGGPGNTDSTDNEGKPESEPELEVVELASWPEAADLRTGDRLVIQVDSTPESRRRFVAWLRAIGPDAPTELTVAPCSATAGGTHRLWCIATARVLLPDHVRVEARHDLIGIRLAQIAVGFGADTLGGPIEADRSLPLAGVTRPNEGTAAGLSTLVRQLGLTPRAPASSETQS